MSRGCRRLAGVIAGVVLAVAAAPAVQAQYFGRNKVQYRTFSFEVLKTEHFDIYHYPEGAEAAQLAARLAERWYARLSRFFGHDLRGRQAIVLYAASAHFRQTNAVEGLIGEGTGGLTEAIKRRIVLPMSGSLADTDHVLGHELVHAFQFDLTGNDPRETSWSAPDILYFPLWFAEGMAEYLTLGPLDSQTTMWLRDAAIEEKLPHLKDLNDPSKYFPYRWGHAFWAYVAARYGDRTVASLVRSAANPRFDLLGLARQLGTDPDTLTAEWHQAIIRSTEIALADEAPIGSRAVRIVTRDNGGGRYNVGPRVSPDGREVAFFSERGRFSVELYIADADTGRVTRRLSSTATDPHFDSLEFLNSAGGWSPDGRTIAVTAIRRGRPVLALIEASSGRVLRELPLGGLDDAFNPSYAPDGASVVLGGNRGGLMDLYRVMLASGDVQQLTSDPFADLEPTFTPDGRAVVFVTERFSADLETLSSGPLRLARLELATGEVRPIAGFLHAKHLSPQVTPDGRFVTFLADPDGITNVYRLPIDGGPIVRLTAFPTGVAGITASSPALGASLESGRLVFSVFEAQGHVIYRLDEADTVALVAPEGDRPAALLPGHDTARGEIHGYLSDAARGLPAPAAYAAPERYTGRLGLDMLGQPMVGGGISSHGGYITGSMSALFTDMLGDRVLGVAGYAAGSWMDVGGEVIYLNRKHRWTWAALGAAVPYRAGLLGLQEDEPSGETRLVEVIERQASRGGYFMAAYPFNVATRLEVSGGGRAVTASEEVRVRVYSTETREFIEQRDLPRLTAPALYLTETTAAVVNDTSFFGATSPIFGSRARLEVGQTFGSLSFTSVVADYRRYFMPKRPVTIAVRALHFGRYGVDAEHERLLDFYAGYPELIHGYGIESFDARDCNTLDAGGQCAAFTNLLGSRIGVFNLEVRAPLVGLFRGDLEYGRVPVEVAAFYDAGVAWSRDSRPAFAGGTRALVRSAGAAARVNIFGMFVIEVAASRPLDRPGRGWQWQVGMRQGF